MGVSEAEEVFKAEYPADPRMVHEVREMVQKLISGRTASADELEEVKVAVSEAFSNAVCHGSPDGSENTVTLGPGEYAINPPGAWHTADIDGEATALFITAGIGTQHRPR